MTPVWDVAPHPGATDREAPGSFREHDIAPFPGGMQPPQWTNVPALIRDWIDEASRFDGGTRPTLLRRWLGFTPGSSRSHPFLDGNGRPVGWC